MKKLVRSLLLLVCVTQASAGCVAVLGPAPEADDDDDSGPEPPPPDEPPPPGTGLYVRGSMAPLFRLMPRAEYGRLTEHGVAMADSDFVSSRNDFVSVAAKMQELGAQIAAERGVPSLQIIDHAEDEQRAQQIPFRGNPSDVDFVTVGGRTKAYVPLGGDLMSPGNEVAAVDVDGNAPPVRIRVGVRPQRLAIHPAGLVFVCNQYSNYISVIDPQTDQPLRRPGGQPVEIATEMFCTDLLFVPRGPAQAEDPDEQDLYVANGWRASVLVYGLTVIRDPLSNRPVDVVVTTPASPSPANQPAAEISGVGSNPYRLSLAQDRHAIFVANNRGGELARIDLASREVRRIATGAPTIDVVSIDDILLVPTTMRDRGLLDRGSPQQPLQVLAGPAHATGLDGADYIVHPGALYDDTLSYNFEDVRNGLLVVDARLGPDQRPAYFTDDVSSEPNFVDAQKVLNGALPQAVVRNAAGTRAFLALSGSDRVQELEIRGGAFRVADLPDRELETEERPFALALDEARNQLYVADWGGEVLEVFDLATRTRLRRIDLGYATADYPSTVMEQGEYLYYNADWSNNRRKSCASCHVDELLADGLGFSNGATAPTAYHQVPSAFNLLTTDSYFWNGSFRNGSYASLASDAQSRTNCELVLFGLIEGPTSDPDTRIGDPNDRVTTGDDGRCRPQTAGAGVLPDNFDEIAGVIAEEKQLRDQLVQQETGLPFQDVARIIDFFAVSELRLPPNPLRYLADQQQLAPATSAALTAGAAIFRSAGCANCHDPDNARQPFADGLEHGAGATWRQHFVDTYLTDPRITGSIGSLPQIMLEAISPSTADREVNVHLDPVDYFSPFCFDVTSCLSFEDPLAVRGNPTAETERLDLLVQINLANPDRGFVPGNVRGQPAVNTPSLRGVWWRTNFLRHGLARTMYEAVLAPGHQALRDGETGYAMDALGEIDVHGITSTLSPEEVEELYLYVQSIQ